MDTLLKLQELIGFADGYLQPKGWFESLTRGPRDHTGPLPWYTYPAIAFLKQHVRPGARVFEFGGGFSTLWWAQRAEGVFTVESDEEWTEKLRELVPANVHLQHVGHTYAVPVELQPYAHKFDYTIPPYSLPQLPDKQASQYHGLVTDGWRSYGFTICDHPRESFDVIVVDGMARVFCAFLAPHYLKQDGFIVFDNADRHQYNAAFRFLHACGFRRIDFYGPGPGNHFEWSTAVFFRDPDALWNPTVEVGSGDLS